MSLDSNSEKHSYFNVMIYLNLMCSTVRNLWLKSNFNEGQTVEQFTISHIPLNVLTVSRSIFLSQVIYIIANRWYRKHRNKYFFILHVIWMKIKSLGTEGHNLVTFSDFQITVYHRISALRWTRCILKMELSK